MDMEAVSEAAIAKEPPISLPFPTSASGRMLYAAYLIVLPVIAFLANNLLGPEWQSERFPDYIKLILFPNASLIFFVLLTYSIICYLLLLIDPDGYAQILLIRIGIYTGVFLALQYSILSVPVLMDTGFQFAFLLVWIFPLIAAAYCKWVPRKWGTTGILLGFTLFVVAVSFVVTIAVTHDGGATFMFLIMALVMSAPFWSFLIALRAAFWLFKNYETRFTWLHGFELTTWLAAYAVAWRFDILKMYELYAALPNQPPGDCYIATAAARGHPRFVGAWSVPCAGGRSLSVNRQLQRLKCAELALMVVQPCLHKPLRQIYDVIGKHVASRLQNPFLADAAYLLLKPCEVSALLLLKMILPEIDSISKKMYM